MCPMLRDLGSHTRVKILKKVKVRGVWKFCPVVLESNGKLKDKVRVEGRIEEHTEGAYYIEWREQGQRRRGAGSRTRPSTGARSIESSRAGCTQSGNGS